MGIKFKEEYGKESYCLVPETITDKEIDVFRNHKRNELHNRGWSKERTLKEIGRIPQAVLYNYAHTHGIPNEKINEFYCDNKGKRIKQLLNEFSTFRIGDSVV